jgi:hypothetical protein
MLLLVSSHDSPSGEQQAPTYIVALQQSTSPHSPGTAIPPYTNSQIVLESGGRQGMSESQ